MRRLCPACKREIEPDAETLDLYREVHAPIPPNMRLHEPVGCVQCGKAGTRGRLAVHEVMVVNNKIQRLTMDRAETSVLRRAALDSGMVPMIHDGLAKAAQGLTCVEDIIRKVGLPVDE